MLWANNWPHPSFKKVFPDEGKLLDLVAEWTQDETLRRKIIQRILEHLGLWAPLATERSPPRGPASWPRYADLPLTYHPLPDIA
jgi:hypothetical protein